MTTKLRTVLLANWGLGLEVLKTLHHHEAVEMVTIVSQSESESSDPWKNVVFDYAVSYGYETLNQQDVSFHRLQRFMVEHEVDLLVCHAFMRILPPAVLLVPKRGSINIHASLLPSYRGPAPTHWVLANKEKNTGLTCHYMDEGVDTGDIIHQVQIPVYPDDHIENVIERQKKVVEPLLVESLKRLVDPGFRAMGQDHAAATFAPKPN